MTSFFDSLKISFYEDSGVVEDDSGAEIANNAETPRDLEDEKLKKCHVEKQIKSELEFLEMILDTLFDDNINSENKSIVNDNTIDIQIKRLERENAELLASCDALEEEREGFRREKAELEKKQLELDKSIAHWTAVTKQKTDETWARYEELDVMEDEIDKYNKLIKEIEKNKQIQLAMQDLLTYDLEELQEENNIMEAVIEKNKNEFDKERKEMETELEYQMEIYRNDVLTHESNKKRYEDALNILKGLRKEVAELQNELKDLYEREKITPDDLGSVYNETKRLAKALENVLLENKTLKTTIEVESLNGGAKYLTQCLKSEAYLEEKENEATKYKNLLNTINNKIDELESKANNVVRDHCGSIKIGDTADFKAKNLLRQMSFFNFKTDSTSERLSFEPVQCGPRNNAPFRPDQSTHYDKHSGSFCNSPKSNRRRPSSASSEFKFDLRCNHRSYSTSYLTG